MAEPNRIDFSDAQQRDAFGHWLSGFTDGEGSFNLTRYNPNRKNSGVFGAAFSVEIRTDDLEILEEIKRYFGCGTITFRHYRSDRKYPSNPTARFQISRHYELVESLIPHFDKFPLRAKKRRDYVVFREAVILWHKVALRPHVRLGFPRGSLKKWQPHESDLFLELRERLRSVRKFSIEERRVEEIRQPQKLLFGAGDT
jgi:hypothetical protein